MVWDTVHVEEHGGAAGTEFPVGTSSLPSNNMTDALTIAANRNVQRLVVGGEFTLPSAISHMEIVGSGSLEHTVIELDNQELDIVSFANCVIKGHLNAVPGDPLGGWAASSSKVEFVECYLLDVEDLEGVAKRCQIDGDIRIKAGGWFSSTNTVVEGDDTIFDMRNAADTTVSMDMDSGWAQFVNAVAGSLIELNVKGGEVSLGASCVGGDFYVEGVGTLFNDSAMTIKENHLVWDEPTEYHEIEGSTGLALTDPSELSVEDKQRLLDVYRIMGLDPTKPLIITDGARRQAGTEIDQNISLIGNTVTVTRQ